MARISLKLNIMQHKAEVRIRSQAEVGSVSNPKQFLESVKMQEDIKEAFENTTCTSQQHKLILAYVAANIIFTNVQRPGVVQAHLHTRVQRQRKMIIKEMF